jgi:MtN3 and saliva related transmembrane protein
MADWVVLGLIAGALTTSGLIPQIVKGYRTKRMHDVSTLMISILCAGMSLWIVYGYLMNDLAILISNVIGATFLVTLIAMKLHYADGKPSEVSKQ